jgi:hypothetical protein
MAFVSGAVLLMCPPWSLSWGGGGLAVTCDKILYPNSHSIFKYVDVGLPCSPPFKGIVPREEYFLKLLIYFENPSSYPLQRP